MPRIALIHALAQSVAPAAEAFARLWPQARVANLLDDSLSADLARDGAITPAMHARFLALARYAAGAGADGILFTCSAFGPCIEACARALAPLPVLKPNEAMVREAAASGGRVGLLATFAPTLASMPAEFPPGVGVRTALAAGALARLEAGDCAGHDRIAAEAARGLADCDVIALAQFSLARAAPAVAAAAGRPTLTTPDSAVRALRGLLGGGIDVKPRHMNDHRRGYHHGNLREALIDAVLDLVAERGLAGVTLADVARAVGVSAAAPYRHFRDLNALIAEASRRGYERFRLALEAAWDGGKPDPVAAIENCGRAYLRFARQEPATYAIMFDAAFPVSTDPALAEAAAQAFGVLRQAAEAAAATLPKPQRPPALMMALHIWAFAHGVAGLFIGRNDAARFRLPMQPEDLLEAGLLIYLQSLGLTRPV